MPYLKRGDSMDTLDANTLQIGFGIFFILLFLFVLFLRKSSISDIMTPPPPPRSPIRQKLIKQTTKKFASQKATSPAPSQSAFPAAQKSTLLTAQDKPILGMDRKKVNTAGKVIGIIGMIMIFAPLPDGFAVPSMVVAYAGYMIAKASAPPKEKKKK